MSNQPSPPEKVGPYEISSLLGCGGMGEVYKAYDPRLDRWVAVKHIRPEFALNTGYHERLAREARTIASLHHPAVVQIFDVIEAEDGGQWIVMEWVDGPTLYAMLESGPLDQTTTLALALDVIYGLAQAHDRGILHRDLKSENVMISRSGSAKILDFGLSKRLQAPLDEATLSIEGRVIGTCRVMSPEQANGRELDGRADLFAFGVLLYEMVTGRSPFRASTPMASMLKAFSEPHRPVYDYNPDVPAELSDLIDRLLEKNREDRPQTAQEVAAKLARIAATVSEDPLKLAAQVRLASRSQNGSIPGVGESQDETVSGGGPSRHARPHSGSPSLIKRHSTEATLWEKQIGGDSATDAAAPSRPWMGSVALGLGLPPSRRGLLWSVYLLGALAVWWTIGRSSPTAPPAEAVSPRIVVLPFENLGPESMSHFVTGLTDELMRELSRRRELKVVSYRTAAQYGVGDVSLQQIERELGIGYVVEGAVASSALGEDTRLRVSLRLIRVTDGQVLLSRSLERTTSDTFRLQSELADAVSAELGMQILADTRRDLSAEPLALDAFFRGLTLWHGSGYTAEVAEQAERWFESAVEADPRFVRAWAELSRVRSMIYFNGNRTPDRRRRAEEAIARCRELDPDSISVLLASGYFEYQVLGNLEAAKAEFQSSIELAPHQVEAQEAMGFVLRRQGRLEEAIGYLEQAFDLDRANHVLAGFLAETERARRQFERAESWFSFALRTSSDLPYVVGERAENTLARSGCGELSKPACATAAARQVLDRSDLRTSPSLWGYRVRVAVFDLSSGGSREDFLALYDSVAEHQVERNERLRLFWRKVLVLRELGRDEEAAELADRYLRELKELAADSESAMHHALLSLAFALQGERQAASAALERAIEWSDRDRFSGPRVGRWAAAVHLLLGDPTAAVTALEAMSRKEFQLSLASYEIAGDPLWQPLRDQGLLDGVWMELRRREGTLKQ